MIKKILICFLFLSCMRQTDFSLREGKIMGTSYMVKIPDAGGDVLLDKAVAELNDVEGKFSSYLPESEISKINRMAGVDYVAVSKEVSGLIKTALEISRQSKGAFDPTVGPLLEAWGFKEHIARFPSDENIREVLGLTGTDKVIVESDRVKLLKKGMELDLGGIAKGYAVDKAVSVLRNSGIDNAIVEVGGDLYCLGSGVDSKGWKIGIRDPRNDNVIIATITITDKGVATSGNYENYFMHEGVRFSHIIDPRTGYPVQGSVASVTVVSSECAISDAWATALSVLGWQKAQEIVESNPDLEAVLLKKTAENIDVWVSSGLKEVFEK